MSGRSPSPPLNRRLRHHRTGLPSNRSSGSRSFNSSNTANCVPPRLPCYSRANRTPTNRQQPSSLDENQQQQQTPDQQQLQQQQSPAANLFLQQDSDDQDIDSNIELEDVLPDESAVENDDRVVVVEDDEDDDGVEDERDETVSDNIDVGNRLSDDVVDPMIDDERMQSDAFYDSVDMNIVRKRNKLNDFDHRNSVASGSVLASLNLTSNGAALNNLGPSSSSAFSSNITSAFQPLVHLGSAASSSSLLTLGRSTTATTSNNASLLPNQSPTNNPLHNWQSTKQTLRERFSFMFCNEILADVHFIVGRGEQRIPAHKFVLSVGSAVFDAMFNGAMAVQNQDDIELPDVEPAAFLALLKFLYSDDFQIGPESVMTTLYTAKKYAVPALEHACVDFLKRNLNPDNAFMLLTQARLFDEPTLAKLCFEMIDKHTTEALNAEGFTDIDLDTLSAVMERDTLRIREVVLFQAVVRWSVEECHRRQLPVTSEHQRQALGRALHLIRFPLMTVEEFAQTAAQSGILTDREVVNLFLFFTVNPKPSVSFLDIPRCCVTGKEQVVNRFQKIEGRWGYSGTPDRIKFNVDRRIFVVGFGLYGSIHGPSDYAVTIQIIHCGSGKVLATNDTSFQCDGSMNTFRVLFKEPAEISPGVTYIASACLKGVDSHYGAKGVRRIVHQSSGGCCITFQFTYAAGNNNGTSVEDGQIPEIIFYTKLSS